MLTLDWNNKVSLELMVCALAEGAVFLGTSDTVLGLLANATVAGARQLDAIKQRREKPYIVLIHSIEQCADLIELQNFTRLEPLVAHCWPGPVTIICKAKANTPGYLCGPDGTLALRIPQHAGLQKLLEYFFALFSTSANVTGDPVPQQFAAVDPVITRQVYGFVQEAGVEPTAQPSTILDATQPIIRVIREGAFPIQQLESWYGEPFETKKVTHAV